MPDYFNEGFVVREPAWHGLGVVLDEYPGREEGMRLAGHDFTVVERPVFVILDEDAQEVACPPGFKALVKHRDGEADEVMHIARESYGVVQNSVGWDIVDAMVGEGAKYETGITLKDGLVCSVLAWLDEPYQVPGDNAIILPYFNVSWTHDGSGKLTARPTSIRTVCWNTQSAAEALGKALDVEFEFSHSRNVMSRVEDAKMALKGVRAAHEEYLELARELATIKVTEKQRELFLAEFLPMPEEALLTDRVAKNVDAARGAVRALFDGPTVPDDHRFTAYGLHLAGGEYLDHLRGYRNKETRFGRSILRREPAKAKMTKLIREVVAS